MTEMKKCPSCLREIKISSNFCKYCGEVLKQCPKCLEFNRENDAFCGSCGTDIKEIEVIKKEKRKETTPEMIVSEEKTEEGQPKLIVWPPVSQTGYQQTGTQAPSYAQRRRADPLTSTAPTYEAQSVKHPYNKVRPIGYLMGPLPTINVLSSTFEAFALALALIAAGGVIVGLGFVFFNLLVFPIIGGILGGALILSAPFFGIYYVSSGWFYKTFSIKRPIEPRTIVFNYGLATLIFTFIGLLLAPLFIEGGALSITISVIGSVIFLIALTIIPLKAFLADLVYVKAAIKARESDEENEEEDKKEE